MEPNILVTKNMVLMVSGLLLLCLLPASNFNLQRKHEARSTDFCISLFSPLSPKWKMTVSQMG
jgi:hypothetical protein